MTSIDSHTVMPVVHPEADTATRRDRIAQLLQTQQVEKITQYVEELQPSINKVEVALRADAEAMGNMVTQLQLNDEAVQAKLTQLFQHTAALRLDEGMTGGEGGDDGASDQVGSSREASVHVKAEGGVVPTATSTEDDASIVAVLSRQLERAAQDNARLEQTIAAMEAGMVSSEQVAELREQLAVSQAANKTAAENVATLQEALAVNLEHLGKKVDDEVATAKALVESAIPYDPITGPPESILPRHPAWEQKVQEVEQSLDKKAKYVENSAELKRLRNELEPLRGERNLLKQQLNNARSDAQCATYQNGVLIQQLASLLYQYDQGHPAELPVTKNDLAAFGSFELPNTDHLLGVPAAAPNDHGRAFEVVNFQSYCVAGVKDLIERNSQLTAQLWKKANAKPEASSAADGQRPLPTVGRRRTRDDASDEGHGTDDGEEHRLRPDGTIRTAGFRLGDDQVGDRNRRTADAGTQSDPLVALRDNQLQRGSDGSSTSVGITLPVLATAFTDADIVGAESLIAASIQAQHNAEVSHREALIANENTIQLLETALAEALQLVQEQDTRNAELQREVSAARHLSEELQLRLSLEASAKLADEMLPMTVEQHLTAPLKLLESLENTLGDTAPGKAGQRAADIQLEDAVSRMAMISDQLRQQEEAMSAVLRLNDTGDAASALSVLDTNGAATAKSTVVLREEINRLRKVVTAEQEKVQKAQQQVNAERVKHTEMLERVWRADEECLELRRQHQADLDQMQLTVPSTQHAAVTKELEDARTAKNLLELEAAKAQNELNNTISTQTAKIQQVEGECQNYQQQVDRLQQHISNLSAEAQRLTVKKSELEAHTARLQADLEQTATNVITHQTHIQKQNQELANLKEELEVVQGRFLAQQSTQEQVLAIFPGDKALELALRRLAHLEASSQDKDAKVAAAEHQCNQYRQQYDIAASEKASLHHQFVLHQSTSIVELETARQSVKAAEDALSNVKFQLETVQAELESKEGLLQAALERESVAATRIEALAADPTSVNVRKYGVKFTNDIMEQMEELHQSKKQVEEALATTQATVEVLEQEKATLQDVVSKLEAKTTQQAAVVSEKTQELEDVEKRLKDSEAAVEDYEEQIEAQNAAFNQGKEALEAISEEYEASKVELQEAMQDLERRQEAIDCLQQVKSQNEETISALTARAQSAEAAVLSLQEAQERQTAQMNRLIDDNRKLVEISQQVREVQNRQQASANRSGARGAARSGGAGGAPRVPTSLTRGLSNSF